MDLSHNCSLHGGRSEVCEKISCTWLPTYVSNMFVGICANKTVGILREGWNREFKVVRNKVRVVILAQRERHGDYLANKKVEMGILHQQKCGSGKLGPPVHPSPKVHPSPNTTTG